MQEVWELVKQQPRSPLGSGRALAGGVSLGSVTGGGVGGFTVGAGAGAGAGTGSSSGGAAPSKDKMRRARDCIQAVGGFEIFNAVCALFNGQPLEEELDLAAAQALVEGKGGNCDAVRDIAELIAMDRGAKARG